MKQWFVNPNRLAELLLSEELRKKIDAALSYRPTEVLKMLLLGWLFVLSCIFSLIFIVRLALSIPLF